MMHSKKIELPASDLAIAIDLAKEKKLEIVIDKLRCSEPCVARILYPNTAAGFNRLLDLIRHIHVLELAQIRNAMPPKTKINLHLLIPKNKKNKS